MKVFTFCIFSAMTLASLTGCGSGNPPASPVMSLDSLSPAEREKHCFMNTTSETDSTVRESLKKSLDGTWQHYPESNTTDADDSHRTLNFEFYDGHDSVTQSEYHDIWNNIHNFKYKKICISTPLDQSAGAFADFRVLEMMSADDEGAVALAFKGGTTSGTDAKLLVSDYYYVRYPDTSGPMPSFSKLLGTGSFKKIWTYNTH